MQTHALRPSLVATGLALLLAAASGCGSDPPPKAPVKTTTTSTTTTAAAEPKEEPKAANANTETASNIHIDDAILKACGIQQSKAFFAFDSAKVTPDEAQTLDAVAKCFSSGPLKGKTLKIVGHADPRGDCDYNFALGQARADSVAKYLGSKGLASNQVQTTSRGAMEATGTDEPGWAKDRRVDLMLG
jgi:peptidoglycan-associated lipoprotein